MKYSNKYNIPDALAKAFEWSDYDGHNYAGLSVTTLIGPAYQWSLRQHNGENSMQDISDKYYTFLGSIAHSIVEKIAASDVDKRYLVEERFSHQFTGVSKTFPFNAVKATIHGKFDIYDKVNKKIQDYKFTTKYQVKKSASKVEWIQQLNILRYILIKNGLEVDSLDIVALIRDFTIKDKFDKDLPDTFVAVIPIPVWSMEETEEFITARLEAFQDAENQYQCSAEERWATKPAYAVKKIGNIKATKLFTHEHEAIIYKVEHKDNAKLEIIARPGTDGRCENYCNVNQFCQYFKEKHGRESTKN